MPRSHTDGDTMVWFRGSDVIATGDLFSMDGYPRLDLDAGGSINGIVAGLNAILDLAFAEFRLEGGTLIVPGHGRLSDSSDVAYYRDMVTTIRDRVQQMLDKGASLEQVKASKPTLDYDTRFGATSDLWTTDMFVTAVYRSLAAEQSK
jgi:glyoxylase-like metal-dependent hydrolase (beta-lactamase superfamily II)